MQCIAQSLSSYVDSDILLYIDAMFLLGLCFNCWAHWSDRSAFVRYKQTCIEIHWTRSAALLAVIICLSDWHQMCRVHVELQRVNTFRHEFEEPSNAVLHSKCVLCTCTIV
jgi:hypothetical protein